MARTRVVRATPCPDAVCTQPPSCPALRVLVLLLVQAGVEVDEAVKQCKHMLRKRDVHTCVHVYEAPWAE